MPDELRQRRIWAKEHEALLALLADRAGVQCHTWYKVDGGGRHPEDDVRYMVETGENGSGHYVMVSLGFDSDMAKLLRLLDRHRWTLMGLNESPDTGTGTG